MSKIKLSTLTPVHIGSGNFLQNNMDFVQDYDGDDSFLYVIDPKKILEYVGIERIDEWVKAIENRQNIKSFVKNAKPKDYSSRSILSFSDVKSSDTLKECIHNGMGLAYIPGSSIKGAIRTAVLATYSGNLNGLEEMIDKSDIDRNTGEVKKKKASAQKVESELFGGDPNTDFFRFIQIGDAYFDEECEVATNLINLNQTHKDTLLDESKHQIVEAIGSGLDSEFQMKIAKNFYEFSKSRCVKIGNMPTEIQSVSSLFDVINEHTKKLVNEEIEYWENCRIQGAEGYIENMNNILDEVNNCQKGKECILRIGHASGWRFITGAWVESLDNFEDLVVPVSRPNNHHYTEYDFPKSRRLDADDDILGFVKLSIEE